jgi:hypothetical protein
MVKDVELLSVTRFKMCGKSVLNGSKHGLNLCAMAQDLK